MRSTLKWATTALVVTFLFFAAGYVASQRVTAAPAIAAHLNKPAIADHVFMVLTAQPGVRSGGTGFLLNTGYSRVIVTNRHVCEINGPTTKFVRIVQGTREYLAAVGAKSERTDLCFVKVPPELLNRLPGLRLAGREPVPNQLLVVYGHPRLAPLAIQGGYHINFMSVPHQDNDTFSAPMLRAGRTSVVIVPGNSGSPILNADGRVVGVIFAYEIQTGMGLYVPASEILQFVQDEAVQ